MDNQRLQLIESFAETMVNEVFDKADCMVDADLVIRRVAERLQDHLGDEPLSNTMETRQVLSGFAVVVLDRGFVYVGNVECDSEWCVITDARNIRKWGTTKGLGELVQNGPTPDTVLDVVRTVRAPMRAVISVIESGEEQWKLS